MPMTPTAEEETLQLKVSSALKKRIRRCAMESDETLRTFILRAVQQRGVAVSDAELRDRRKAEPR